MKVVEEFYIETAQELRNFVWSEAQQTVKYLTDDEIEQILDIYESSFDLDEYITDTELNGFFWFETETIAEWLGYESFDEIMNRGEIY